MNKNEVSRLKWPLENLSNMFELQSTRTKSLLPNSITTSLCHFEDFRISHLYLLQHVEIFVLLSKYFDVKFCQNSQAKQTQRLAQLCGVYFHRETNAPRRSIPLRLFEEHSIHINAETTGLSNGHSLSVTAPPAVQVPHCTERMILQTSLTMYVSS
jgi:hypothetical protein